MLKPPHPVARAAYALAMAINPNNHARDGGRASSAMEIEAVAQIARHVRLDRPHYLGHLTSSGTIANLEALWVAGQIGARARQDRGLRAGPLHPRAHLRRAQAALRERRHRRSAAGSRLTPSKPNSARAMWEPSWSPSAPLRSARSIPWTRSWNSGSNTASASTSTPPTAAISGSFPIALDEPARRAFAAIDQADSIVVDPHKHGLQPYGCGCVLFRDPAVGRFYKHDSPYTYFTSNELHLGEISLECSRAGAAAVALWATQRLLPPVPGGEFARGLARGRAAALELDRRLREDARFRAPGRGRPELDIVVWKLAADPPQEASERAQKIFDACAARNLHLALVQLPNVVWVRRSARSREPARLSAFARC